MASIEPMSYLTAPLREVAQHHLKPNETVLTAIYAHHNVLTDCSSWKVGRSTQPCSFLAP